jgi:type VI secretion system Hcp family effector
MFLKVEGFDGGSSDKNHPKWSDVTDYRHAVRRVVDSHGGLGGIDHDDLVVLKTADASSAALFDAASRGERFTVLLEACRMPPAQPQQCILLIELTNASVESDTQNEQGETVRFSYVKIEWLYRTFDKPSGDKLGEVALSWDLARHEATGPTDRPPVKDAAGYAESSPSAFLRVKEVPGEANLGSAVKDLIGLSSFTRDLSALHVAKGTDIATPILLSRLHKNTSLEQPRIDYACDLSDQARPKCSAIQLDDLIVAELSYGASQVERVTFVERAQPK